MTIAQLKSMFLEIDDEEFNYLLWEWTAYPMATPKTVVRQFRSKIRSLKNKRDICWYCTRDVAIGHRRNCPNKGREWRV
jgi:hypothetical protein